MHFVTKVLVVFCAILSLVLAALTMAYATNADRIRGSFEAEREEKLSAQATARSQIEGYATEKAGIEDRQRAAESQVRDLTKQFDAMQAEKTELRSQVEQAKADAISIRNQLAQFGATADSKQALIKNYRDEVTKLRDDLVNSSKREIELVDRINDLSSQREVLEQNARALKEQLEEIKLQTAQAGSVGGLAAVSATEARELSGPLVRARVLEVASNPTGDLIVISEGANRGLKQNTIMNIVRGNDFVARIVLITVEPDKSVGRVNLYGRSGAQVMKDDTVLSRLDVR